MKNDNPEVTILIPCYNSRNTIGKCLSSISNQTYKNIRVLIFDDGSTDDAVSIINTYANLYYNIPIVSFSSKQNMKRGYARNWLVKHCKTELARWVDADDQLFPEAIEQQVQYMVNNPSCKYACTNYQCITHDGFVKKNDDSYIDSVKNLTLDKLIESNPIAGCTVMFRTDTAKEFLYNEDPKVDGMEDWDMWKQVYTKGYKVEIISDQVLYTYSLRAPKKQVNPYEQHVFRFDDVCSNMDMENCNAIAEYLHAKFPNAEIQYALSPLAFEINSSDPIERQRVYPSIFNAISDITRFFCVNKFGIGKEVTDSIPTYVRRLNHGLFHVDHRFLTRGMQEMSILGGANLTQSNVFAPPFNKFNADTVNICRQHNIALHTFEYQHGYNQGWSGLEHEPWDGSKLLWYLHSRFWTVEKMKKKLGE